MLPDLHGNDIAPAADGGLVFVHHHPGLNGVLLKITRSGSHFAYERRGDELFGVGKHNILPGFCPAGCYELDRLVHDGVARFEIGVHVIKYRLYAAERGDSFLLVPPGDHIRRHVETIG